MSLNRKLHQCGTCFDKLSMRTFLIRIGADGNNILPHAEPVEARTEAPQAAASRTEKLFVGLLAVVLTVFLSHPAQAADGYSDWAAVVVAGDWHAHDGSPSDIFDNARRDVARNLIALGFARANLEEFSARPGAPVAAADAQAIGNALWDLSNRTSGGCFLYFSSHGSRDGLVLGNTILDPSRLAKMVNNSCADKPTVVVVSACFSGVFVAPLQAPNRLILTAARADRASFGCGQTDRYSYFDQCVLSSWPQASGFASLGRAAQACVAAREKRERIGPPSEPQLWIGNRAAGELRNWP